jgi:peptide-methionine (S)-S-oxide reductase
MAKRLKVPEPERALKGRPGSAYSVPSTHAVLGTPLLGPWPEGTQVIRFGLGCFWGAEKLFWQLPGVYSTIVGYGQGTTPNPTYEEVCSGMTGHNEIVEVVFDPEQIPLEELLRVFWEGHDPTQGMRQGNDLGTQYRSGIYFLTEAQRDAAIASRDSFAPMLVEAGYGPVTTEIEPAADFYPAEEYHQQYLHKVPNGYCGLGGTGVSCPIGIAGGSGTEEQ